MKYLREQCQPINTWKIKEIIDPIDFYFYEGHDIRTRKKGEWKLGGLCSFHNDQKEGSFFINTLSGAFKCFSCGARGGDIIDYMQKRYEITFWEACQRLSKEWERL